MTALTINHAFVNPNADSPDDTITRPSDWNDDLVYAGELPIANGGTGANAFTVASIPFMGAANALTEDTSFTYNDTNNTLLVDHIQYKVGVANPAFSEGLTFYDDDEKTIGQYTNVNDIVVHPLHETDFRATNKTGVTLTVGQVVYVNGAQGNRPTVALANASTETASENTIGIVKHDIVNNGTGLVVMMGLMDKFDTSAFTAGDTLYLSTVAGEIINTKLDSPDHAVFLGIATRISATDGEMLLRITDNPELEELHDVLITSVADKNALLYDSASSLWKNRLIADADLAFTDITTNNSTISKHGFLPKLSGTATQFLNGEGNYATPAGVASSYTKQSFTSQTSITVTHNFGAEPTIQVYVNDFIVTPSTIHQDSVNSSTVTFTSSTSGYIIATLGSPQAQAYISVSDNYTTLAGDRFVEMTAIGKTVTLLTASNITEQIIMNSSIGSMTVASAQLIDGEPFQLLASNETLSVIFNGSTWRYF